MFENDECGENEFKGLKNKPGYATDFFFFVGMSTTNYSLILTKKNKHDKFTFFCATFNSIILSVLVYI